MSSAAVADQAPPATEAKPATSDLAAEFASLRADVFRQTGVSLPSDDPAIALVLLNRLVMDRYTESFEARVQAAVGTKLDAIRVQAVKWAAEQMVLQQLEIHDRLEVDLTRHAARVDRLIRRVEMGTSFQMAFWVVVGVVLAILLLLVGVLIGRVFLM